MSLDQRDGKLRAFYHLPVKALTLVTLERFGRLLDPAKAFLNQYCLQPDWQGLAEQMGYTFDKIKEFSEKINSTIGQLLDMIEKLGRYDVLEDEILEECIVRDVKNFEKHQKTNSVQDWKVQSGRIEYFDAIINYSVEDIEFVNNLRKRLEGELHLKLFIKERDLIVGTTEWSALIDVIERRSVGDW
ncbi:hypothetical protein LSH36_141g02023 [Paralvinella palmiformis]|uniref:TIR domain-containing protein n=1 Tax=Paralvinella palmiformis TaxID=53620 RepID=A0AAD9JVQ4_9ANNE|nr:hypothetical protein LSH36_141g02023 [Paralvinella palmiformis]